MHLAIVAGGTTERRDSIISGKAIEDLLKQAGHSPKLLVLDDFTKPTLDSISVQPTVIMLHGGFGEGGPFQGYLEMAGIPYSGSRSLPSALALNKWYAKRLFREAGIPVPTARLVRSLEEATEAGEELGFPLIAKPIDGGSSQGVVLTYSKSDLLQVLSSRPCDSWLLETYIAGRNVTVAILENKEKLHCFRPLQILLDKEVAIYSEEAKLHRKRRYALFDPLDSAVEKRIVDLATACHQTLGCFGPTRVDFVLDPQGSPWVLEINTVPGMSENGNYRSAYRMSGVSDQEFCELLLGSIV